MGEMVYDRISYTWVSPDEMARRRAYRSELAFQMQPRQGELCAPMVISDSQRGLMSMTNGQMYDSKSEMRKEYKRAGVAEVGDQAPTKIERPTAKDAKKERQASIGRALSQAGFGAP